MAFLGEHHRLAPGLCLAAECLPVLPANSCEPASAKSVDPGRGKASEAMRCQAGVLERVAGAGAFTEEVTILLLFRRSYQENYLFAQSGQVVREMIVGALQWRFADRGRGRS